MSRVLKLSSDPFVQPVLGTTVLQDVARWRRVFKPKGKKKRERKKGKKKAQLSPFVFLRLIIEISWLSPSTHRTIGFLINRSPRYALTILSLR